MDNYTVQDLKKIVRGNPTMQISLALMTASSADDILSQINPAIDYVLTEFARTPKERFNRTEDGLSMDLVTSLRILGFQASHDTTVGGHCDIVIEGKFNFLWLGEAKIHNDYDWLLGGFNQLDTRYATAGIGQDHGGIIIYNKGQRTDRVLSRWADHLSKSRPDVRFLPENIDGYAFSTVHQHRRTGRNYHVRHVIVSIYWDPDKS